jgi:glycosyltransferase involved in cell wall biosynthesis
MKPLVSILTPSFNQGQWLAENLKSVEAQTYERIEHIVADGASTDNSLAILECSNAAWESRSDEGQSHAINDAFRRSSGEIIGWLNSDDAFFHVKRSRRLSVHSKITQALLWSTATRRSSTAPAD